jgi:hypothetical protein
MDNALPGRVRHAEGVRAAFTKALTLLGVRDQYLDTAITMTEKLMCKQQSSTSSAR